MQASEQVNELAAALAKAQGELKNAPLNKVNPHFKSKYADLAGIRDAVTPALSRNGLSVVQVITPSDSGGVGVVTRLMHQSGQWVEGFCPIPNAPDMQKLGSAITYARRYGLSAICGISADEDDDANAASEPKRPNRPQAVPAQAGTAPVGFDGWLTDLEAVADEGTKALEATWQKSDKALRKFLTDTNPDKWAAIKAKAAQAA